MLTRSLQRQSAPMLVTAIPNAVAFPSQPFAIRANRHRPRWSWHMRRNLRALLIGAFLDVGVIYAAAAADVPIRTPVYAPPVLYNWSGLYLGANVGGAWSNRTLNVAGTAWDGPFSTAFIGGFQLGYNLQAGHFVVGVEGDFDWASFGRPSFTVSSSLGPVQFSDRQKWISTVAARFGITSGSGRLLAYGKVGG